MTNTIHVPITMANVFAEVVQGLQEQGVKFHAETNEKDFIINVTGV